MRHAVTAGESVVGEAGHLEISPFQQDHRPGQPVEVDPDGEEVVQPAEGTDVV